MNTMQDYIDHDTDDTLSLSNFLIESDQFSKPNHSSKSSSSSSPSSSSSEQDFVGFYNQEWSNNTSYDNIVFCGKVVSLKPETTSRKNTFLRSNSDSFRFVRLKTASRRSYSMPNRSKELFPCKKSLMVFMFGSGSSKFPTKVDMSVIKSRQLRQQSASADGEDVKSGKNWWRLVDVLGCNGGYEKDM